MGKYRECCCTDWKENIDKFDAIFHSAYIHGVKYEGKEFDYCPWCRGKLKPRALNQPGD